jgi:hypothetical protein
MDTGIPSGTRGRLTNHSEFNLDELPTSAVAQSLLPHGSSGQPFINWAITWQSCVTSGPVIHPAFCQLLDVITRKTRYPWSEPFRGETARGLPVSLNSCIAAFTLIRRASYPALGEYSSKLSTRRSCNGRMSSYQTHCI